MGHKIHPTGFRIGVIYGWQSRWYADGSYTKLLHEDLAIRTRIMTSLADASVAKVDIDRSANQVSVTIHTAKPGIVIGRQGAKVEELRNNLDRLTGRRVRVNIQEIRTPELDAYLVARSIADQLQRRIAFRRAMKQGVQRTMQRGAKGIKVIVAGRLGGSEMSRRETEKDGRVPLHTLRADIDYGFAEAHTTFGRIGVKVWIYKGDILPAPKRVQPTPETAEAAPEQAVAAAAPGTVAVAQPETPSVPQQAAAPAPAPLEAPAAPVARAEPAGVEAAVGASTPTADPMAEMARLQAEMGRMQEEMARIQAAAETARATPAAPSEPSSEPAAGEPEPGEPEPGSETPPSE